MRAGWSEPDSCCVDGYGINEEVGWRSAIDQAKPERPQGRLCALADWKEILANGSGLLCCKRYFPGLAWIYGSAHGHRVLKCFVHLQKARVRLDPERIHHLGEK